jgi:hypothetical protein
MSFWSNAGRLLKIAVLFLAIFSQSTDRASAECTWDDIIDTAKDGISDGANFVKNNSQCSPYFSNPGFWIISGAVTAGAMASSDLRGWCQTFQEKYDDFKDDQKKIGEWLDMLPDDSAIKKGINEVFGEIAEGSAELLVIASFLDCSCAIATESGVTKVVGQIGECGKDGLCWLQDKVDDWLDQDGPSCKGTIPSPTLIDCANAHPHYKELHADNYMENVFPDNRPLDAKGDFVYSDEFICYCPAPMTLQWHYDNTTPGINNDQYASCDCPAGTHKAADDDPSGNPSPALYRICLCNKSNLPMNADGSCPPPPPKCDCKCAGNQVPTTEITADNQCKCGCKCDGGQSLVGETCVTPCKGASIRLASGACCHPSRVSTCGNCCVNGTVPDAASGSCVSLSLTKPKGPNKAPNQSFPGKL